MSKRRELYRIPEKGRIAGVCAGLSEYSGIELWLVRIIAFSGLLLSGSIFFLAYVAAWFILEQKDASVSDDDYEKQTFKSKDFGRFHGETVTIKPVEIKEKIWQRGEPPRRALHDIVTQFSQIEGRLQKMERYVTSPEFTVAREINKL